MYTYVHLRFTLNFIFLRFGMLVAKEIVILLVVQQNETLQPGKVMVISFGVKYVLFRIVAMTVGGVATVSSS